MSDARTEDAEAVGEGAVSGNQASIPAVVRERADIEDGDRLRWYFTDGRLEVEVVRERRGVFEGFEGFESSGGRVPHDEAGLEPAGEWDGPTDDE